jgi:hypothetical protein
VKTKIQTKSGIDIFVDDKGWFSANINNQEIRDRTLNGVIKKIATTHIPIDALIFDNYYSIRMPQRQSIVPDKLQECFRNAKTGKLLSDYLDYRRFDADIMARIEDIVEEYRVLVERFNTEVVKLERLRI